MVAFKNNKPQSCGKLLKSVHQHSSVDSQGSAVWNGPCAGVGQFYILSIIFKINADWLVARQEVEVGK